MRGGFLSKAFFMGRSKGFEPSTPGFTVRCSNQLSYDRHASCRKVPTSKKCRKRPGNYMESMPNANRISPFLWGFRPRLLSTFHQMRIDPHGNGRPFVDEVFAVDAEKRLSLGHHLTGKRSVRILGNPVVFGLRPEFFPVKRKERSKDFFRYFFDFPPHYGIVGKNEDPSSVERFRNGFVEAGKPAFARVGRFVCGSVHI